MRWLLRIFVEGTGIWLKEFGIRIRSLTLSLLRNLYSSSNLVTIDHSPLTADYSRFARRSLDEGGTHYCNLEFGFDH